MRCVRNIAVAVLPVLGTLACNVGWEPEAHRGEQRTLGLGGAWVDAAPSEAGSGGGAQQPAEFVQESDAAGKLPLPTGTNVALAGTEVCWTSSALQRVECSSWANAIETAQLPLSIVSDGEHVFWTELAGGVQRARVWPLAGEPNPPLPEPVVTTGSSASALALGENDLFVGLRSETGGAPRYSLERFPKRGGVAETLLESTDEITDLAVDASFVFFTTSRGVYRIFRP
jgi:hypothetical protein